MKKAIAPSKTQTSKVTQLFSTFTTVVVGSSLKLNYCELDRAISLVRKQYAVGTVEVRIVQLRQK